MNQPRYCTQCGTALDPGANFCVTCGAQVWAPSGGEHGYLETYTYTSDCDDIRSSQAVRRPKLGKYMAVLMIGILLVAVGITLVNFDTGQEEPERSYTVGDITMTEGLYRVVSVEGSTLTYPGSGVVWYVKSLSDTAYVATADKRYELRPYTEIPGQSMQFLEPGYYAVYVESDGGTVAKGTVILDGTITDTYAWHRIDSGRMYNYSFQFSYPFSDYLGYAMKDDPRRHTSALDDSRFVVVDETILSLENALETEYLRVHGTSASTAGQDYADYLLSFVQCVIDYPTMISPGTGGYYILDETNGIGDLYLNGRTEYWSYPLETLYHGSGDCEDTTFLSCALFSAAGYQSAVVLLENHMMSAVFLDSFVGDYRYGSVYASYSRSLTTGETFYFCETTYSSAVPVGYYSADLWAELKNLKTVEIVKPYVAEDGQ